MQIFQKPTTQQKCFRLKNFVGCSLSDETKNTSNHNIESKNIKGFNEKWGVKLISAIWI